MGTLPCSITLTKRNISTYLLMSLPCRERALKFEEGSKMRAEEALELAKLTALQERMVHQLEAKGVDPRYLAEMKAVDIAKILKR